MEQCGLNCVQWNGSNFTPVNIALTGSNSGKGISLEIVRNPFYLNVNYSRQKKKVKGKRFLLNYYS